MANHRHLGMDWQASVAAVAVQAAKAQKRSETASTGAVSRRRYETEKRSLTGYATTEYVDNSDAATLESAKAYVVETVTDATVDLTGYCTTTAMQEYVQEYVDGIAEGSY